MTGTNIPEGHRRAFESLTRGDYNKLRDQSGIVADARLHDLRPSCVSEFAKSLLSLRSLALNFNPKSYSHRIQSIS